MIDETDDLRSSVIKWGEVEETRRSRRARWEVRAGQWRALELAREVFGDEASIELASYPDRGAFRGMVHVGVPFCDFDDHRERESRFEALATVDPVLERVPLIFVFDPDPKATPPALSLREARGE